jgi:hypothetical protein
MGFVTYDGIKEKYHMNPLESPPDYKGREQNRKMGVLIETWRHEVMTVWYLAQALSGWYQDEPGRWFKHPKADRVKDSVSRYVQEWCDKGLMKQWPRMGQKGEYPLTLTDAGEKFLEEYGFPYRGRAKQFAKGESLNAAHHVGATRTNLKFLDSGKLCLQ